MFLNQISSVAQSCPTLCDPHGLQHTRLPCPSLAPGAYSNSCPLCRWCHLTISSSVIPFSSSLQSFPASGSFPMSQFFASGGHSIGVSASAAVLPMNIQAWFPLGMTGLQSVIQGTTRVVQLWSKGLSSLIQHHSLKPSVLWHSAFIMVWLSHPYMTTRKIISLTIYTFVNKVMSLFFSTLSRFVMGFLPGASIS